MPTLNLPQLRRDQLAIVADPAKVRVVCCGRRWGKSIMGGTLAMACASKGAHVAWVAPTYKPSRPLWRFVQSMVGPLCTTGAAKINQSEREVEFRGGGRLGIYSADSEDSIRGESFHVVVVDEAARVHESVWTDVLQPTLADYGGEALLIGTPRGHNWFWQEWTQAKAGDRRHERAAFQAPSSANPNPNIQRAARLARERVSERTYLQEWEAQFMADGGGIFRGVPECATAERLSQGLPDHTYVMGVDWGRTDDATVFVVMDAGMGSMVMLDRMTQTDYHLQVGRLKALCERFRPTAIMAEANSMGGPLTETLQRERLPVRPFVTTNATKAIIVDALALAFERREIAILNDPLLVAELQAFESTRLPSGLIRYAAPEGMHDDTVMALALAWSGLARTNIEYVRRIA